MTRGFGVSVHKTDCPNVVRSRSEDNLSRWVRAEWERSENTERANTTYEAKLQIVAEDKIGVLAGITMALADMKVSISQINTQAMRDGQTMINLNVGCKSTSHYQSIVSKLKAVKYVISVTRGFGV